MCALVLITGNGRHTYSYVYMSIYMHMYEYHLVSLVDVFGPNPISFYLQYACTPLWYTGNLRLKLSSSVCHVMEKEYICLFYLQLTFSIPCHWPEHIFNTYIFDLWCTFIIHLIHFSCRSSDAFNLAYNFIGHQHTFSVFFLCLYNTLLIN